MEINTRYIKISSRIETDKDYELGQEIELPAIKGEIVKTEQKNNQDGSYDVIYIVKPL